MHDAEFSLKSDCMLAIDDDNDDDGFFLACEDFGGRFDYSFPLHTIFIFLS